jgi:hypothetical protein
MLIKSFVTVAVTTSYRNKNWELKLSREGNDTDSKFWNQGSGIRYKANKGGRTRLPENEATFRYESFFVNYFGGSPTPTILAKIMWTPNCFIANNGNINIETLFHEISRPPHLAPIQCCLPHLNFKSMFT